MPLPSCKVPKFRFSTVLLLVKAAAAWSSTVRVAVAVCGRLEEFGSLPVKEIVIDAEAGGSGRDGAGLASAWSEAAGAGRYRPQRALPLWTAALRV